jgi:hypothetical protein
MTLPVRRVRAFGVDYLVIAAYLLALLGICLAVLASNVRTGY